MDYYLKTKVRLFFVVALVPILLHTTAKERLSSNYDLVNVFIGTGEHGHTHPGATMPFGAIQLGPDTRIEGWDASSGYHASDDSIMGFSHTHLSGTGIGDFNDILVMPSVGNAQIVPGNRQDADSGFRSRFQKQTEVASPGYYRVHLDDYDTNVELTATQRVGMHRYRMPPSENARIIVDLNHRDNEEILLSSYRIISDKEIVGTRVSLNWAAEQHVYFYAVFDQPFHRVQVSVDDRLLSDPPRELQDENIRLFLYFDTRTQPQIQAKVALSPVDIEGAQRNMSVELNHWNFDQVKQQARDAWTWVLGKIEIEGGTLAQRQIFYTALYQAYLTPNIYMDTDRRFRGLDKQVHIANGFTNYTVFSLWDTFRSKHPLLTILEPEKTTDFINSLLSSYDEQGLLPMWELAANDTETMIGYHAVSFIADADAKGIRGFNLQKAYQAGKASAEANRFGLEDYRALGYVPTSEQWSASKTLEYAYNDWALAQLARANQDLDGFLIYTQRAQNYRNLYNRRSQVMRPRLPDGQWLTPFDPYDASWESGFIEANAWQYTWFVPHDVYGLIELMGGRQLFISNLDRLYNLDPRTGENTPPDVSGLIGQYAHGNEPSHHIAYLHNYVGEPWKTQNRVREIMELMYANAPEGLVGNEDCGQMSSWYVFTAMGFYPFPPGSEQYLIGSPIFSKVTIFLPNGNTFVLKAPETSTSKKYIASATLNRMPHTRVYLTHVEMLRGGELELQMTDQPSRIWGTRAEDLPQW